MFHSLILTIDLLLLLNRGESVDCCAAVGRLHLMRLFLFFSARFCYCMKSATDFYEFMAFVLGHRFLLIEEKNGFLKFSIVKQFCATIFF